MSQQELFIESLTVTLFFGVVTLVFLYWYFTKDFDYWKKRGIPYTKPLIPFLGSLYEHFWKPAHQIELERYQKLGPIYGQFDGNQPVIAIHDLKLIREVLVKEFPIFINRRMSYFVSGSGSMIELMLFMLQGDEWRRVRGILSPNFTTGKIKKMVSIIKECGQTLAGNFKIAAKRGEAVTSKQIYGAFTMDVIASTAFSVKLDSYNDPKNKFVQSAKQALSTKFNIKIAAYQLFPRLVKLFGIELFPLKTMDFFKTVVLEVIEQRIKANQTRNDFLQLMMASMKGYIDEYKGEISNDKDDITTNYGHDESTHQVHKNFTNKNLSFDSAVSQSVQFFLAGFDTVAATITFASYLLALNPEIQEKAFEEIREVLEKKRGELTYETIQEMKYLDNVLSESLRLYPVLPRLERVAETEVKLGDSDIIIPKGMVVLISTYALHRDPKYFPNPEKFDPDRFLPEERAKRDPYCYMPFGSGPRACIGMRFALTQVKTCLACVLASFKICRSPETKVPLEFHLGPGAMIPKNLVLKYEERTEKIPVN